MLELFRALYGSGCRHGGEDGVGRRIAPHPAPLPRGEREFIVAS
jgi:hypothetical protein